MRKQKTACPHNLFIIIGLVHKKNRGEQRRPACNERSSSEQQPKAVHVENRKQKRKMPRQKRKQKRKPIISAHF